MSSFNLEEFFNQIVESYCKSNRWNGVSASALCSHNCQTCAPHEWAKDNQFYNFKECQKDSSYFAELQEAITFLVQNGDLIVVYDMNPAIKRFPDAPIEIQLKNLYEHFDEVYLYPTEKHVSKKIDLKAYDKQPFTQRMWQGVPQLQPIFFEAEVLETYVNDPRFDFRWYDFKGSIFLTEEHYDSKDLHPRDKTFLEHFGLGFRDKDRSQVICAPAYYLSRLTPEHQQRWATYEVTEKCYMDELYYETSIRGEWTKVVPLHQAVLSEIKVINKMCKAAKLPELFNETFENNRPKHFRVPFRPTKEAFHASINDLDKMTTQNLNKKFFNAVLKDTDTFELAEHKKAETTTVVEYGTLKLLETWIFKYFRFFSAEDEALAKRQLEALRVIRKIRQTPAHKVEKDEHSRSFIDEHYGLVDDVYFALRMIRLVLANYEGADQVEVPEWLFNGDIRFHKSRKKSQTET